MLAGKALEFERGEEGRLVSQILAITVKYLSATLFPRYLIFKVLRTNLHCINNVALTIWSRKFSESMHGSRAYRLIDLENAEIGRRCISTGPSPLDLGIGAMA